LLPFTYLLCGNTLKREEDKTEEIISRLADSIFSTYAYILNQMMIVVNDKRNFKYV